MKTASIIAVLTAVLMLVALTSTGCASRKHSETTLSEKATTRDPERAAKLVAESSSLLERKKLAEAEAKLREALEADPQSGPAHNNLGVLLWRTDRAYDAAHAFEAASRLMPADPVPANNLGLLLERAKRFDDAIVEFTRAQSLAPAETKYMANLVRARLRRGDKAPELRTMLKEIALKDPRAEWRTWAADTLTRMSPDSTP